MSIKKISNSAYIINTEHCAYSLSTNNNGDEMIFATSRNLNWEYDCQHIAGKRIVPYGVCNDLPIIIRDMMQDNNLAPGIIQRQKGLLFGEGAFLYRNEIKDGQIQRIWVDDPEIMDWLRSWQYEKFIEKATVDYLNTNGYFSLFYLERGHRIGRQPRISHLKFVSVTNARLEWTNSKELDDVAHIFTGDFENDCITTGIKSFPTFNPLNPAQHPVSASYNYAYSFGRNFYSTPAFMGAMRWILRGSDIPTIFKYVTDNGLNLAYHIHSPSAYWNAKKDLLAEQYPSEQPTEIQVRLDKIKEQIMDSITEVLSGKTNAGKFFESVDFYDDEKNLCSWKIEAVDQKIKDFVEAQLKIGEAASSAITSGMQLHPSLTNIVIPGTLGSGSQMLYALKVFLLSDVRIPEMVILDPINQAIRYNFNKDLQLGFYHRAVLAEESVAPSDRVKNS